MKKLERAYSTLLDKLHGLEAEQRQLAERAQRVVQRYRRTAGQLLRSRIGPFIQQQQARLAKLRKQLDEIDGRPLAAYQREQLERIKTRSEGLQNTLNSRTSIRRWTWRSARSRSAHAERRPDRGHRGLLRDEAGAAAPGAATGAPRRGDRRRARRRSAGGVPRAELAAHAARPTRAARPAAGPSEPAAQHRAVCAANSRGDPRAASAARSCHAACATRSG